MVGKELDIHISNDKEWRKYIILKLQDIEKKVDSNNHFKIKVIAIYSTIAVLFGLIGGLGAINFF